MDEAHKDAEAVRNRYRKSDEEGTGDGNTRRKRTSGSSSGSRSSSRSSSRYSSSSRDRERLEQIDRNIGSARRAYEYGYISEENMSQISH